MARIPLPVIGVDHVICLYDRSPEINPVSRWIALGSKGAVHAQKSREKSIHSVVERGAIKCAEPVITDEVLVVGLVR